VARRGARRFVHAAAIALLALAGAGPACARVDDTADEDAGPIRGSLRHDYIPAPSLGQTAHSVRVYLPSSYDRPESARRRYPVIVLLHGWPGGDGNWPGHGRAAVTLDSMSANGTIPEVIALMPNGNGIGILGRSLYLNSFDGRSRMEDFVAHDLVAWADSTFRTLPDSTHRGVIGLSEGGTAAINLAFKHPGVFGACGGMSGQYRLAKDVGMKSVFGPEPGATRMREANSPTLYADRIVDQLHHESIYFDCGRSDGLREDNREFDRRLTALGVPHTYREFPGHHGWGYWKAHLRDALLAVTAKMR
jgi:S-formylglutathione hydrolase FrmB